MKSLRKLTQPYRRRLLSIFLRGLARLASALPADLASNIGAGLGWLGAKLVPGNRRLMRKHLTMAFGDTKSPDEIEHIIDASMMNLGRTAMEILGHRRYNKETVHDIVETDGIETYRKAWHAGKGTVLVGGHLGNWEYAGGFFPLTGLDFHVVVAANANQGVDQLITEIREGWGENVYHRDPIAASKVALKVLRQGGTLAAVFDQDVRGVNNVFVDFLGHPASTISGPAALSIKMGAPMFVVLIERTGPAKHRLWVEGPVPVPEEGTFAEKVQTMTATMSDILEAEVRRRPEEWVWMHRRWRTQPLTNETNQPR